MLWDTHTHSKFSPDGCESVEDMVKKAKDIGLSGLILTDHFEMDPPILSEVSEIDYPEYFKTLRSLQESVNTESFTLGIGVELGLQTHLVSTHRSLLSTYDFDFVIGSVHSIDGNDPYFDQFYIGHDLNERMSTYYDTILQNLLAFPEYDSIGHLDYINRYINRYARQNGLPKITSEPNDTTKEILKLIIEHEISLEINTGPFRSSLNEPNPCYAIVKQYYDLGGRMITIGSDAHHLEHIGLEFESVREHLKGIGFKSFLVYQKRKPCEFAL